MESWMRLKISLRQMCVPLCGRFCPNKGDVADYVDRGGRGTYGGFLGADGGSGFSNSPVLLFFYGLFYFPWNMSDFTGKPDGLCCVNLGIWNYSMVWYLGMESWYEIKI